MKTHLLLLLSVLLGSVTAHANLGETEAQIEARYGPVKGRYAGKIPNSFVRSYFYHSLFIDVVFIDGKSESEFFLSPGGDDKKISPADAQALLDANTPNGGEWYRPQDETAENSAYAKSLILIYNWQKIANAGVTDHTVGIDSKKYVELHLVAGSHL